MCVLLLLVSILLIITASLFGANKTVDIFGVNIFMVETAEIPSAPKGSAVLVQKGTAETLEEGKLVLYLKADADNAPTLGYVKGLTARDGVTYVVVNYKDEPYEFSASQLVGRADYASKFLGGLIGFVKTPLGVMVLAVLPCAALILFEVARTAAKNRPEPEVIPKVKNAGENTPHTDIKLSVDKEGKASYAKDRSLKPLPKDNDVLFSYSGKQKSTPKYVPMNERPIIPLTDKKTRSAAKEPEPAEPTDTAPDLTKLLKQAEASDGMRTSEKRNPAAIRQEPKPANASAAPTTKDKTAEIVNLSSVKNDDAFFAQSSTVSKKFPQIGRQRPAQSSKDEEASKTPEKPQGKRSAQILASRGLTKLLDDDDDSPTRRSNESAVDDILAGLNRKE